MKNQINTKIIARLKFSSQMFGDFVCLIGLTALVGWQFDVIFLKRIVPSFPIIAPNTALAFFLGGLVLIFLTNSATRDKYFFVVASGLFSSIIAFVGFLTLAEYIFGLNLGLDGILFPTAQAETAIRMSPQSAFNFLMAGVSLLFFSRREKEKKVKIGQAIILLTGAVSLVSLFGFIYNIPGFYTIAPYKGMAAHTAVAFVAMFFGILSAFPEIGFMRIFSSRNPSGITARRLFATLVFILAIEILTATGRRSGLFGFDIEALLHLLIVAMVFVYLIFFAFRSLDKLGKMETNLVRSRELDRAKTEFVGMASHQLRTPLTAVAWYAEMLLGKDAGELNKKQENYLQEIYAGNRRMIDLVDDLLNTSRIDMGTLKVKPESVKLSEVINSILDEFSSQISQKKISVEKKISRGLPPVKFDPELLRIVFQNILSNAVKYISPNGKIAVEIKRQDSRILVKIADNGWGIPAHQQKKIFTKLFRADNVRKKDTEGTGLGLYIAQAIVKKSGGKIRFESEENKGTAFYITLKA